MIYKMTLTDLSDTMTFNLLETPIVDKDIEGAVDNVTLDGNQYTDYLYLKKQYIQKWAIMCPDEYDELRGFYTRQFEEGEVPLYRVYYGANVTKDYIYNGDYFQFNAKGLETGMYLSQLTGNATQDGTPTPDAPAPISTVTGENTVKVVGKNLFKGGSADYAGSQAWSGYGNTAYTLADGAYTMPDRFGAIAFEYDNLTAGQQYTISFDATASAQTGVKVGINRYINAPIVGDQYQFTATTQTQRVNWTFTATEQNRIAFNSGTVAGTSVTISNIQLELGSTATVYEPYQGQEFPIDLGSYELAKIGDYQDRIYKNEGKWYIEKQIGKVDLSTLTWQNVGGALRRTTGFENIKYVSSNTELGAIMAEKYTPHIGSGMSGTTGCIAVDVSAVSASDASGTPTGLAYYALATPTTTEITDETLLAQLNFIASLYEGVNNISIVGTGAQGEMEVLIRDVLDVERDVVPETPVRLTLTDGGVINACGCRRDVQLTMRETTE